MHRLDNGGRLMGPFEPFGVREDLKSTRLSSRCLEGRTTAWFSPPFSSLRQKQSVSLGRTVTFSPTRPSPRKEWASYVWTETQWGS